MADIKQAAKWLGEGKTVTRDAWGSSRGIWTTYGILGVELEIEDMLAEDWKIQQQPPTEPDDK
jgi:hypothetical protein